MSRSAGPHLSTPSAIHTASRFHYPARNPEVKVGLNLVKNMAGAGVSGITREEDIRGTIPFMPPEQVLDCRMVRPEGDLYAVGATLYWLLAGEYAYDFDAVDDRGESKDPFIVILEDPIVPIQQRDPSIPPPCPSHREVSVPGPGRPVQFCVGNVVGTERRGGMRRVGEWCIGPSLPHGFREAAD